MALGNIHEWADDEIITHDDLNSIAEAVSQEIGSGSIPATSLLWPLVAQGTLDMNGNSIENIEKFLNVYHVNSDQTLLDAINGVNGDTYGVIVIDPGFTATAAGYTITADRVAIIGDSASSSIDVTGASFGLKFTGSQCSVSGIRFSGSGGVPAILLDGTAYMAVSGCYFTGSTEAGIELGGASTAARTIVTNNHFTCGTGISFVNTYGTTVSGNIFYANSAAGIASNEPTSMQFETISGNVFHNCDSAIDIVYTGTTGTSRGLITITGNSFYDGGSGTRSVRISGFYKVLFSSNAMRTILDIYISGLLFSFVNNQIYTSEVDFSVNKGIISGNIFQGDLVSTLGGTGEVAVTGNYFQSGVTLNTWMESFVGNTIDGTVTETGLPTVYGLNVGW